MRGRKVLFNKSSNILRDAQLLNVVFVIVQKNANCCPKLAFYE